MNEFKYTGTESHRFTTQKSMKPFPDANHIGYKKWKLLTYRQRKAIMRDRENARHLVQAFEKEQANRKFKQL